MAAVFEISSVFEQVYNLYIAGKDRWEKYCRNPELANSLAFLFKRLLDELTRLADNCRNNAIKLPDHHLQFYAVRIEELNHNMTLTCKTLKKKIKQLNNPFYRIGRAVSTYCWLSELETSALRADELLRDITACFVNATLISHHTEDVAVAVERHTAVVRVEMEKHTEEVASVMSKHTEAVTEAFATGSASGGERDTFCPSYDVPDNPSHVVLNFQLTSGLGQATHPPTIEASLKSVVLNSNGLWGNGSAGPPLTHAVGMEGMSGVGKSCALRGLAKDSEVRQRFRHGIYFVILGKDATEADVAQQIAKAIMASGGTRIAREVREENSIDTAVSRAKQWFSEKCTLLLIDEAWAENDVGCDVLARLSSIMYIGEGSRVVFTTRDVRTGLRSELIHFSPRDTDISRQILLASVGLREQEVAAFRGVVDDVLGACGGLPMALAIAGSAIKLHLALQLNTGSTGKEVWASYLSELQWHRDYLLRDTVDNDPYQNLSSQFMTSLLMLDKNITRRLPFEHSMSFSEMYRALIVLQRQGWVPVPVLERVWDTEDEHETLRVLQELTNANLGQREDRMMNGKKTPGISLHDLHLDFVQKECKRYGESEKWHRKLLEKYLPEDASIVREGSVACRDWCKDEVFKDDYIRNNVSRHLLAAKLGTELLFLLRNPKWTANRLRAGEFLQLEDDFRMMLDTLRQGLGAEVQRGSDEWCIKAIVGAARLGSPYVSRNPDEVWFQLYARLLHWSLESDVIRKYLSDIEGCAERPWVKALSACLPEPGGALQSTVLCDGKVTWISELEDNGKMVVCGRSLGEAFVTTVIGGHLEKTVWLTALDESAKSASSEGPFAGSAALPLAEVSEVCCTRDGARAVTGHADGTVQLWDARKGKPWGETQQGHNEWVECVALSANGNRAASGSGDSTVLIWNAETGEPVGDALIGHSGVVECVALSADGKFVASGSTDTTVRVWDVETGELVGNVLRGYDHWGSWVALSPDGKFVASRLSNNVLVCDAGTGERVGDVEVGADVRGALCAALSDNGKRVASGSNNGTVQVFDVKTRVSVGSALRVDRCEILCVSFSADGKFVASGSEDGTVRVWDTETEEPGRNTVRGHCREVKCVTFSADGKRAASGSVDGTVLVWDAEAGRPVGGAMGGINGFVGCVAFSEDRKRVAAGTEDGTVRVWGAETRKPTCRPLQVHTSVVHSVTFSADGKHLASGSWDRTALLWDLDIGDVVQVHEGWTNGDLRRLFCLSSEEGSALGGRESKGRVRTGGPRFVYKSRGGTSTLATLEHGLFRTYSKVGRRIVAVSDNEVYFFELVL